MQANKRRDTKPELALRRLLHRGGLRFRVDYPLPPVPRRRADIAFPRWKLVVFVDGCAWHGCPVHGSLSRSKTNIGYWSRKINDNMGRDRDTDARLRDAGWTVLRFWEHEPTTEMAVAVQQILLGKAGINLG